MPRNLRKKKVSKRRRSRNAKRNSNNKKNTIIQKGGQKLILYATIDGDTVKLHRNNLWGPVYAVVDIQDWVSPLTSEIEQKKRYIRDIIEFCVKIHEGDSVEIRELDLDLDLDANDNLIGCHGALIGIIQIEDFIFQDQD